jgi:hypothetical protein
MRLRRRAAIFAGATAVLLASVSAAAVTGLLYQRFMTATVRTKTVVPTPAAALASQPDRQLPADAVLTVLVESYPDTARSEAAIRQLTAWLEASGHRVYYQSVDLGPGGRWKRVLAGTYTEQEYEAASWDAARLKAAAPVLEARVISRTPAGHHR